VKICIFGAGAIGGLIGARLAANRTVAVSLVARGAHLAAMRANGLTLKDKAGETNVRVTATDDPSELGPQDYVIVALKAHSVPPVLASLQPLLGPETAVVTAQNGVPWWYFYKHGGHLADHRIEAVDPGGRIWDAIGPEHAIGCVVYPAAEIEAPGVIRHVEGDRFPLGEPSGEKTERISALSAVLVSAGLRAAIRPQIRNDIWVKLWGNLSFNPISALTGGTLVEIATDPGTRAVARAMMVEAQAIGEALGVSFGVDVDRRIEGAAGVGAHKTSMLQDLERGRPMEIDALVTAVQELGRLTGVRTPAIDMVLALVRQRARLVGCYPG
jgi:2-dehydropantoate 2-reductase